MKRFLIFTVLFSLGISAFAQEYYYWYRVEVPALPDDSSFSSLLFTVWGHCPNCTEKQSFIYD
jgi:hypothetical protein